VSTSSLVAVQVGGIQSAIAWDAYDDHNCVVAADGQVSCWGVNATGQLGDPSVAFSNTPIASVGIDHARGVAVGSHGDCSVPEASCGFSCALLAEGDVRCWGAGEQGSIGDGRNVNTHIASNVSGITSASALDAGGHVCVRDDEGSLSCWGRNTFSQLGNETLLDSNVPVAVTIVPPAASVAVGAAHSCAMGGGIVRCWGANDVGQLGNGVTNIASSMAQRVTGLSEVVEIAAGKGHSCARRRDGSVWCWGDNSYGQLGRGSMGTPSGVAAAVVAIAEAQAQAQDISVGDDHTCALLADDTLWCWGHNDEGQLGNGGKIDSPLPVRVQGF
jgi:alpha-tubulin suppressor-like RCC1 family protein